MGILERIVTKNRCSLAGQSLVGRSAQCIVRIEDPRVSGVHAMLRWGHGWEVRDLGSSNGTIVDGRRLLGTERAVPLREGSELRFAGGDSWVLASALPPVASASGASHQVQLAESGILVLPDAAKPVACVYEDSDGLWWVEVGDEAARLAVDQETIVAGEPWVLSIPPLPSASISTTVKIGRTLVLEVVTLRFRVSADEEYVDMSIVHEAGMSPPVARAYQYALLTLARARLRDRDAGLPASEQGWLYVEELLTMLRMDAERLNVDIHRARKDLAQYGVLDAGGIVLRRPGSRQIRLGTDQIEIVKF